MVRPLAERFRNDGVKGWFDEWALKSGDSVPAKIEEGLEHSRTGALYVSESFGSEWAQLGARSSFASGTERRFRPRLDDASSKAPRRDSFYITWRPAGREHDL